MLPSGWDCATVGEVCDVYTGGTPNRSVASYWNGDIPWMSSGEINQGIVRGVAERITPLGMANSNARLLPPGTVMMALNGQGKTRGKVAILKIETTCNQSLAGMVAHQNRLIPEYLFYNLSAQYQAIRNITGDDARNGLNLSILRGLELELPPLDEQRRIAEVLRSVDEAIVANEVILRQSDVTISALSDNLFTSAISGDDSEWPLSPLEDMLEKIIDYRGVPPPKADSGIPLLTAKNVRFGYLDFEPREYIAATDYDSWMRRGLPTAGDIMFTTEAPLGNVAEFPNIKAALGQRTLTLVPKAQVLNARFLKWLLLSKPAQDLIWSHATGSTAKGIKQRTFRKLKFGFPALDEQVRISKLLEDIGAARDATKQSVENYVSMKAHLMSDLLSGRVRVPATNVEGTAAPVQPAFKRAVFAAEIVHQLRSDSKFGSVKHEKIVHLCELHLGLQAALDRHAYKEAAGPYDPKARRSVEKIFRQQKWFDVTKPDGKRVTYSPMERAGGHTSYFDRYFGSQRDGVQSIIDLLRPLNTERCEIVVTLYAVWNDLLIDGRNPTDDEIVSCTLEWHPKKREIEEDRWRAALPWMRQKGLVPRGIGEKTRVAQE